MCVYVCVCVWGGGGGCGELDMTGEYYGESVVGTLGTNLMSKPCLCSVMYI